MSRPSSGEKQHGRLRQWRAASKPQPLDGRIIVIGGGSLVLLAALHLLGLPAARLGVGVLLAAGAYLLLGPAMSVARTLLGDLISPRAPTLVGSSRPAGSSCQSTQPKRSRYEP
jgi:hypothetical protein